MIIKSMVSYIIHRTIVEQFSQSFQYNTNETSIVGKQSLSWKNVLFKTKKNKQKKSVRKSKKQDKSDVDNEQTTDNLSNFVLEETENLDDSIIIWLKSDDNNDVESVSKLRTIVNRVKIFQNPTTCLSYTCLLQNEKIFFIVSSCFIMDILPYIDEQSEIQYVYILGSVDEEYGKELQTKHPKIHGIYSEIETLTDQLAIDVRSRSNMIVHLSVFATNKEENSTKDFKDENASRMWFTLLIEVLLRMAPTGNAKDELITECKRFYADNPIELKKIEDFQAKYQSTNAIKWYTYDCFLFRQFNKACRTKNIDALYKLRFFLIDLENQLQDLFKSQYDHTSPTFIVYRGQMLAPTELEKLKNNVDHLVSMNTYLSTTRSCAVASNYAGDGSGHPFVESVVFEIEVDVKQAFKPFADIRKVSMIEDEGEILFSIGTVFKIKSVDEVLDNIWFVKLTLNRDEDEELKRLEIYFIDQIGQTSDLNILRNYLHTSGEHEQADKYDKIVIKSMINNLTSQFGPSEKYFNPFETLDSKESSVSAKYELPADDPTAVESHNNVGILHTERGNYAEALASFEKALQNRRQHSPDDFTSIATIYQNMAIVYESQGDYKTAFMKLKKALQLQKKIIPLNNSVLSATYRYIGECYAIQNKYTLALKFYRKSIQMSTKCLPTNHPKFAELQSALGDVYSDMGRKRAALKHYRRALVIAKKVLPPEHLELECYQEKLDDLKKKSPRLPPVIHTHWLGEYLRA